MLQTAGVKPGLVVLVAVSLFVGSSWVSYRQVRKGYEWHAAYKPLSSDWFRNPLEWNIDAGLPTIQGMINTVALTPDGRRVWIAGDAGLLAYSDDRGRSWNALSYDAVTGEFASAPTPNTQTASSTGLNWPTLVPTVHAAWLEPEEEVDATRGLDGVQAKRPAAGAKGLPASDSTGVRVQSRATTANIAAKNIFDDTNVDAVGSGPSSPTEFTLPAPFQITQLVTYHWNDGKGSPPGSISIKDNKTGKVYGPFACRGTTGQGGAPNVNWVAMVNLDLLAGSYKVMDSDPATWSQNVRSGGRGFAIVWGIPTDTVNTDARSTNADRGTNTDSKPPATIPGISASAPDLVAMEMRSKDQGVLWSRNAIYYATNNGGADWKVAVRTTWVGLVANGGKVFSGQKLPDGGYQLVYKSSEAPTDAPFRFHSTAASGADPQAGDQIESLAPGGKQWQRVQGWNAGWVRAMRMSKAGTATRLWVLGGQDASQNRVFYSDDAGNTFHESPVPVGFEFHDLTLDAQGKQGWLVGTNDGKGVVLHTDNGDANASNGGIHWYPATQAAVRSESQERYGRMLAPWYWAVVLLCALMILPLLVTVEPLPPPLPSEIGNQVVSDRPLEPGEPDVLGLGAIAAGLSFFLRNDKTRPPLAIAINGRWGSGKSSLMNLLKKNLHDYGSRPVWFNAWHHQKEEQLLAALLQAIKSQAIPPLSTLGGWCFRARLVWTRTQRHWFGLAVLAASLFLMYRAEIFLHSQDISVADLFRAKPADTPQKAQDQAQQTAQDSQISRPTQTSRLGLQARPLQKQPSQKQPSDSALESIASAVEGLQKPASPPLEGLKDFLNGGSLLTWLTGLLAGLKVLSSGLTAFGTNPASLLTTISRGTNVKNLDAQTSFRQRFAEEFADVTQALGKRRMLILIDDLDRCRPEKVREVLEAVNFLVSSGDCFIVLGMAREIVEHCVGISFRRVVDTLAWNSLGLSQEEIKRAVAETQRAAPRAGSVKPSGPLPDAEIEAKRRAFARLYLDKLVQIEVSIPEPNCMQQRLLFQTEQAPDAKLERKEREENDPRGARERHKEQRVEQVLKTTRGFWRASSPVMQAVMVAAILAGSGTLLAHYIKDKAVERWQASHTIVQQTEAVDAQIPTTGEVAKPNQELKPTLNFNPVPVAEKPEFHPGRIASPANWLAFLPLYLGVLGAIGSASSVLRRMPQRKVTDTQLFTDALRVWHPLVMTAGAKNTPRTARHFQNRVRYLAMRQRAQMSGTPQSLGERWLRLIFGTPVAQPTAPVQLSSSESLAEEVEKEISDVKSMIEDGRDGETQHWLVKRVGSDFQLTVKDGAQPLRSLTCADARELVLNNIYLPEPLLVAFAAIEEYDPAYIAKEDMFRDLVGLPSSSHRDVDKVLARAVAEHRRIFKNWYNLAFYRHAYLRLNSEADGRQREHRGRSFAAANS